ncbi:MAG: hypothetical protein ACFFDF_00355 [Candidatus Odinarchaeota archaeon]
MPTFRFQKADTVENTVDELIKRIAWLTSKLDSQNVKRLDTNETVIKSADGTTEIVGPVLVQKDDAGTTRLKQGYDSGTGDFIYQLYNSSGVLTVDIDSNGNLVVEQGTFKASIEIGTGNNVVKADGTNGFWIGHTDFASAPYKVTLAGAATMTNLTVIGGTITGALIRTAESGQRTEISTSGGVGSTPALIQYDTSGNKAFSIESGVSQSVLYFWNGATNIAYIIGSSTNLSIYPATGKTMILGNTGRTTYPYGTWNCTNATFTSLSDGTSNYMTENTSDNRYLKQSDGWTGTFTNGDGATVTVTNGQITNVV